MLCSSSASRTPPSTTTSGAPPDPLERPELEPTLSGPLDPTEALRVLELAPGADEPAIKQAFRRLAREHHPDVGGDVATFRELQLALEVLLGSGAPAPPPPPGRPSRDRDAWSAEQAGPARPTADASGIDWTGAPPTVGDPLSCELVARWLATAAPGAVVHPIVATSRAPTSRLNGAAPKLSPDLTSQIEVRADRDDRGREVVVAAVTGGPRAARKALDRVPLDGGWVRRRTSTATVVRWSAAPDPEPRETAIRVARALADLLERARWPLREWRLTTGA